MCRIKRTGSKRNGGSCRVPLDFGSIKSINNMFSIQVMREKKVSSYSNIFYCEASEIVLWAVKLSLTFLQQQIMAGLWFWEKLILQIASKRMQLVSLAPMVATKTAKIKKRSFLKSHLVFPIKTAVETILSHSTVTKTQQFLDSGDSTLMKKKKYN